MSPRPPRPRRTTWLLAVTAAVAVGCSGAGDAGMGADGPGDGALGGSAGTEVLAETTLDGLPPGPLAWTAFEVRDVEHRHAAAFVHAHEDTTLAVDGEEEELGAGAARYVPAEAPHRHGDGSAWDVLLAEPEVAAPDGGAGPVFTSGELEGLPDGETLLRSILVVLPPGTSTSVHSHPGPEFIHVTRGSFVYENAVVGAVETAEGDGHAVGRDLAVQKRNPEDGGEAAFLSWFVVDADEPFTSRASFED